ncbi:MAG: flagellar basal body P-ring protein FlgI [Thermodesulfobacteriota bacterium]|nr:flagellar basal body P-ring protein FlgI [Thermodesulfobacteriota bacterium]
MGKPPDLPIPLLTQWASLILVLLLLSTSAHAVRIKDVADIQGVRQNQLVGYGLVVGLDGTGDTTKATFTIESVASMLEKMGVTIDSNDIKVDNVAAVMVTADLPPFARVGSRIDVLVSSIGDAENLHGGTLLFSPLKGADGHVYAVAQGPVSTGGFSAGGTGGEVQKNFPTVGRVVDGAMIEREIPSSFDKKEILSLTLHSPDFTTASRVAKAVNSALSADLAQTPDPGTIHLRVPEQYSGNTVALVSFIEGLEVTPDAVAKVVINERTGTVVMGSSVRISTVAIAHGNLSIQIKQSADVSQPFPFSEGETVVVPETQLSVKEGNNKLFLVDAGVSIGEVVRALNALGVSPRDLIAIFQAIKAAGALQAKLEII